MLLAITPSLRTGAKLLTDSIGVNVPENRVAVPLADCQRAFPEVAMGSYPFFEDGRYGTDLVLRSTDGARLALAKADLISRLPPDVSFSG